MKASHQTIAAPDPTWTLFLLAASIVLLWAFDAGYASVALAAILALPVLIYGLSRRVEYALGTMIAATALSHYVLPIFGLKARPEHVAIGLILCTLPVLWERGKSADLWMTADYLLMAYIALNLFTSLATSPAPALTFRWAIQQAIVILPYFLLRLLITNESLFRRTFNILLGIGVLQAAYAIICFFSRLFFHTQFGMDPEQYGTIPGTYGVQLEANILGAYSAACLIMLLWIYMQKPSRRLLAGIAITYAAVAISLSRAAIAGACLAVAGLLYCGRKLQLFQRRALINIGLTIFAVSLILAPALVSFYVERLSTLNTADVTAGEDTLSFRLIMGALAYQDILQHPVLGTGVSSFQLTFDWSQIDPDTVGGWIDNSELRIMHDTGLVGLAVFVSFLYLVAAPCWRLLKKESHPELLALGLAVLIYTVSFQTTEGTLMAFFWVHVGLIACGVSIYSRNRIKSESAQNGMV